ncbi:mitogen-activated protein kinase kinase kinase NPK1-like isoform X2 [Telopea speciosissima]|uniref:mitogen-activated protein kinase kinase kinase NPK1-like isoform X2 n=1 Tax=Telopea speciosissima TaxID=54955 RepID=UPI001CC34190|nr:mitogen-activated protein kinase kinase kinase NPK1-like isoform X2 [Telopea speciosissima]
MQDFVGSVRRSLVFRSTDGDEEGGFGGLVEKLGTCLRRSRVGFLSRPSPPALPPLVKDNAPPIRWRKGELIGCGAFGRVYMGMNLDSGELLAVKQVLIPANNASKEKAQTHIRELEEEVKLLKNLSHLNIVRYLGTAREEGTLNILLEFVPGGSISSLLGKFGSFPEPVIRMYTKQLLLGLEYLHKNGIMHRDIKGANILVDNKGCIKLADFGASKQVVELATISGAKSMKGTPYWMAPEVILQTGHSFSADIWSVGCTVIEMATGKPPWSQQYQEVAALFHIGTTKSHPPIPEHLSVEAKDFLLKCLQKEPNLRPTASELLQHPFVTGEYRESHPILRTSTMEASASVLPSSGSIMKNSYGPALRPQTTCNGLKDVFDMGSVKCSTVYPEKFSGIGQWGTSTSDDMCLIDDKDDLLLDQSVKLSSVSTVDDFNKSFNPMCEPTDNWPCKFDESSVLEQKGIDLHSDYSVTGISGSPRASTKDDNDFSFPFGPSVSEDDDEATELKIRAFLDEKALDLKKLQTPLYEEFYNTLNASGPPSIVGSTNNENVMNYLKLPPKSKSPSRVPSGTSSPSVDAVNTASPGSCSRRVSNIGSQNNQCLREIPSPQLNEWKGLLDGQQEPISPSAIFSERQRKWKEELDQELERKREMLRQAGVGGKTSSPKDRLAVGGKTSSPKDRALNRQRDRLWFASSGK